MSPLVKELLKLSKELNGTDAALVNRAAEVLNHYESAQDNLSSHVNYLEQYLDKTNMQPVSIYTQYKDLKWALDLFKW